MRTNATLQTEQQKTSITPYVELGYYNGGGWNDIKDTVREILYKQEPYDASAIIRLDNSSGAHNSLDLKNKATRIGWGAVCSGGNEVSYPPYLWGDGQELVSVEGRQGEPGKVEFVVFAIGAWWKLAKWIADTDYSFNQDTVALQNKSVKEIIDWVCEIAGLDLGEDLHQRDDWAVATAYSLTNFVVATTYNGYQYECTTAGTSHASTEPTWPTTVGDTVVDGTVTWTCRSALDQKVDSWEPVFDIIQGENGRQVVKALLELTKCVLVPRTNKMHLKYIQAGDAVDYTYISDAAHYFRFASARSQLFTPMKVAVTAQDPTGGEFTGEYAHSDWVSSMGVSQIDATEQGITSDADCAWLAQALVERAEDEANTGLIQVPIMNCLQEIHDKVTLTDNRDGATSTDRVGGLSAHYLAGKGIYSLEVSLGGLQTTGVKLIFSTDSIQQYSNVMFDGSVDTPTVEAWLLEAGLPFTPTGNIHFSPIIEEIPGVDVVYIIDMATAFWKYNLETKFWRKLTSPTYSGTESGVFPRSLVLNPLGTKLACISEAVANARAGRRIEIYDIGADIWSASSQVQNMDDDTGTPVSRQTGISGLIWTENDIIWAWAKRGDIEDTYVRCIRYRISFDSFTIYAGIQSGLSFTQGYQGAANAAGTIIYGSFIGTVDENYCKYTIATDTYDATGAITVDNVWPEAQDDDKLWYIDGSDKRPGYLDTADDSENNDQFALNPDLSAGYGSPFGVSDGATDIIALARSSAPELMSVRDGGDYLLFTNTSGKRETFLVEKPSDNFPITCINAGDNQSITITGSGWLSLSSGTWKFYYPVAGDYTQVKIYKDIRTALR